MAPKDPGDFMLNTVKTDSHPQHMLGLPSPHQAHSGQTVGHGALSWQTNELFVDMLNAYRPSGGLARAQEVAAKCQSCLGASTQTLANWVIGRKVICFEWQSKIWMPLFQFKLQDMTLQPMLGEVLSELVAVLDDWAVAHWFSQSNPWLAGATPADAWATSASEVMHAARAERYVALG
jgi:hypothetical protein